MGGICGFSGKLDTLNTPIQQGGAPCPCFQHPRELQLWSGTSPLNLSPCFDWVMYGEQPMTPESMGLPRRL
ncbi:hypothetical protein D3C72_1760500 [compost metagenome]